jgi:hypothetical protein
MQAAERMGLEQIQAFVEASEEVEFKALNKKEIYGWATIEAGIPGAGGEIAFGEGHVWATIPQIPISEIDPETNAVVKQWVGPGGDSIRVGHGSVWLSNLRQQNVWRFSTRQP